jgi:hypothetical protein
MIPRRREKARDRGMPRGGLGGWVRWPVTAWGRVLGVVFAVVLASLLLDCGSPPPLPAPVASTTTVGNCPEAIYKAARWGETVAIEGLERITVEAPHVDAAATPVEVAGFPGRVVVICSVTIENIGSQPLTYDESFFQLSSRNETWIGGGKGVKPSVVPALGAGELAPGDVVRGAIAFQFTEDAAAVAGTLTFYDLPSLTVSIEWN